MNKAGCYARKKQIASTLASCIGCLVISQEHPQFYKRTTESKNQFFFITWQYDFLRGNIFYLRLTSKFSQRDSLMSMSLLSLAYNAAKPSKLMVKFGSSSLVSPVTFTFKTFTAETQTRLTFAANCGRFADGLFAKDQYVSSPPP